MTTTRQAQDLGPRDRARTITGTDAEGTYFHGELIGGDYGAGDTLTLYVGRGQYEVGLDTLVHVTGAVVAPEPRHLERNPA